MSIELDTFLNLPAAKVAELVRAAGPQVCVFPINGTRRWFAIEHGHETNGDPIKAYMDIAARAHVDIYSLFFDHGVDTLLAPMFGSELLGRGEEYVKKIGADGLARLASGPDFLTFYEKFKVRVRFYGDYRRQLSGTPFSYLSDMFDSITTRTHKNKKFRLFYGVFGNDATEYVAEFGARYYKEHRKFPDRNAIVGSYYGEPMNPVTMFIGFDKFSAFDYPLLATGEEDLYFTAAPSLYMNERQLRTILYDHLYTRRVTEPDYSEMPATDRAFMKRFYKTHRETTLGTGILKGNLWYPKLK